jgi:hypothetical protein
MTMRFSTTLLAAALAAALSASGASAQTAPKPTTDASPAKANPEFVPIERTFFLKNVSQHSDTNEVFTALRQLMPAYAKCFLVPSEDAILVQAMPADVAAAQRLIDELDRAKKTYRLTFTVSEMDGAKLVATQRFALVAVAGQMTTMKQNSRVPVTTGSYSAGSQTQFTYMDVGMTFEATLEESVNGVRLKSLVENSGIQEDKTGPGPVEQPVIRTMSLEGASFLTAGKPLMLGSLDIPGSTQRLDVQVVMEPLP